jgi:uncharacterized membrane protein (DUF2068 family)
VSLDSHPNRAALRAIALFEAFKALLSLAAATGLLFFVHEDLGALALRLIRYFHLNPAAKYPALFLDVVARTGGTRLAWLALGALAYASLRAAEAYGLWRERAWAEVLAAASTGLYIPFEIAEIVHRPNVTGVVTVLVNAAVVWIMLRALSRRRQSTPGRQPARSC